MNDQVIERRKSKEEDFNAEVDTLLLGIDIIVINIFNLENTNVRYIQTLEFGALAVFLLHLSKPNMYSIQALYNKNCYFMSKTNLKDFV